MKNYKYKGEPKKGLEFYNLINKSEEFTRLLGKVVLASGKLEVKLIELAVAFGVDSNLSRATLGQLIKLLETNELVETNILDALKMLSMQRNYLTHNIYALLSYHIEETILERENLIDTDVMLYIERAHQLLENINHLSDVIEQEVKSNI